jgi:hypothetical protein
MTSKKFKLLLGVCMLLASSAFAQTGKGGGYNPYDTSVIPAKRLLNKTNFGTTPIPFPPNHAICGKLVFREVR